MSETVYELLRNYVSCLVLKIRIFKKSNSLSSENKLFEKSALPGKHDVEIIYVCVKIIVCQECFFE